MDFSLISGLVSTLKATYDLGNAAMGVRDANQFATTLAQINDQLLKAQQSLFAVSGQAMEMQQQLAKLQEECRKLKAAAEERGRYALVEIGTGNFALQSKVDVGGMSDPIAAEPVHYVCQPCFDKGVKAVLGITLSTMGTVRYQTCPNCGRKIADGAGPGTQNRTAHLA